MLTFNDVVKDYHAVMTSVVHLRESLSAVSLAR
jgi:hypothetical protein